MEEGRGLWLCIVSAASNAPQCFYSSRAKFRLSPCRGMILLPVRPPRKVRSVREHGVLCHHLSNIYLRVPCSGHEVNNMLVIKSTQALLDIAAFQRSPPTNLVVHYICGDSREVTVRLHKFDNSARIEVLSKTWSMVTQILNLNIGLSWTFSKNRTCPDVLYGAEEVSPERMWLF